jgi:hypothetical protein
MYKIYIIRDDREEESLTGAEVPPPCIEMGEPSSIINLHTRRVSVVRSQQAKLKAYHITQLEGAR